MVATKIKEAIFKPYLFRIILLAKNWHRQFGGGTQHLDFVDVDFHLPRRHFRIFGPAGTFADLAVDPHDPFRAQRFGELERLAVGIGHYLREPVMVPQIDEQNPAMIANAMAPAGQANGLANIALAKRAAGM